MRNVILVGFMGTGKSAVGRVVARLLNYEFVDTDQMVEEITGLTINEIFRKYGEIRFRSEEALVVNKLVDKENLVIATGGGLVLNPANMEHLKATGTFVLLTADPEIIFDRVSRKNTRPLLAKGRTLAHVKNLIDERGPWYARYADVTVDTSGVDIEESAEKIVEMVRKQWDDEKS